MVKTRIEDIFDQLGSLKELLERQGRAENERAWQQLEALEGPSEEEYYEFCDKFQTTLEDAGLPNILAWGRLDEEGTGTEKMKEEQKKAYEYVSRRIALNLRVKTKGVAFGIVKRIPSDGVAAWEALRHHFEPQLVSRQLYLRQQFQRLVLQPKQDPALCFQQMDRHLQRMEYLGDHVSEQHVILHVLDNLPPEYQDLRALLKRSRYSYADLKADLRQEYIERKDRHGSPSANGQNRQEIALVSFAGACDFCGQSGHKWRRCPQRAAGAAAGGGGGGGRGEAGDRGGWRGGRGEAGDRGGWRGGRGGRRGGRGSWRNLKCGKCGKNGHKDADCWSRSDHQANTASVVNVTLIAVETSSSSAHSATHSASSVDGVQADRLVVDSGASTHMRTSLDGIANFRPGNGTVIVGGQKVLESTGVGDYVVRTRGFRGEQINLTLSNVLIVPGLGINLLSIPRVYDAGGEALFSRRSSYVSLGNVKIPVRRVGQLFEVEHDPPEPQEKQRGARSAAGSNGRSAGASGAAGGATGGRSEANGAPRAYNAADNSSGSRVGGSGSARDDSSGPRDGGSDDASDVGTAGGVTGASASDASSEVTFYEDILPARELNLRAGPVEIPLDIIQSVGGTGEYAQLPKTIEVLVQAAKAARPPAAATVGAAATLGATAPGRLWDPGGEEAELEAELGRGMRQRRSNLCVDPNCPERGAHRAHVVISSHFAFAAAASISQDPGSYKEAMRCPESPRWKRAMDEELAALKANGTWTLYVLPPGANLIGSRWVYKTKPLNRDRVETLRRQIMGIR